MSVIIKIIQYQRKHYPSNVNHKHGTLTTLKDWRPKRARIEETDPNLQLYDKTSPNNNNDYYIF